jgi:hypothetical protein
MDRDDLEEAIRKVVGELIVQHEEQKKEVRITREAAKKRLQVGDTTLWRWDQSGYLKAIRVGRSVYYLESDVRRIEEGEL